MDLIQRDDLEEIVKLWAAEPGLDEGVNHGYRWRFYFHLATLGQDPKANSAEIAAGTSLLEKVFAHPNFRDPEQYVEPLLKLNTKAFSGAPERILIDWFRRKRVAANDIFLRLALKYHSVSISDIILKQDPSLIRSVGGPMQSTPIYEVLTDFSRGNEFAGSIARLLIEKWAAHPNPSFTQFENTKTIFENAVESFCLFQSEASMRLIDFLVSRNIRMSDEELQGVRAEFQRVRNQQKDPKLQINLDVGMAEKRLEALLPRIK